MMSMVYENENLDLASDNVIFVFGSNLAGRHGRGSALEARRHWGAVYGVGRGRTGRAYAIPTKGYAMEVLPLHEIQGYVDEFIQYVEKHSSNLYYFKVVKIGCGLAGYKESDIIPMFEPIRNKPNVELPLGW